MKRATRLLTRLGIALALTVIIDQGASAQTDHYNLEEGLPTRVEDAYPTAYRNREFQGLIRYERTREGGDRVLFNPRVEFGFARNWQAKISVPFLAGSADRTGSGDVRVEALYNFNTEGLRLPGIALSARADIPAGKDSAGLDTAAKFILTKSISNRLDRLHLNLELMHNAGRREDERSTRYAAILGYSTRVGPDTILVADFICEQERRAGENANIIEAGIRHQVTPRTVFTIGAGAGIREESPKFRISIGIQRSF
jgi:hypothetical protein